MKTYAINFHEFVRFIEVRKYTYFGLPTTETCIIKNYIQARTKKKRFVAVSTFNVLIDEKEYKLPVWIVVFNVICTAYCLQNQMTQKVRKETMFRLLYNVPKFTYER